MQPLIDFSPLGDFPFSIVSQKGNRYWLGALETFDRLKIPLGQIPVIRDSTLSPEEIRVAAQQYLPEKSFIHFTVLPTDTSYLAPAKPDTTAPGGQSHADFVVRLQGRMAKGGAVRRQQ